MSIKITTLQSIEPKVLEVEITGKLGIQDYEGFVPEIETQMKSGKIRILLELIDFHGWTAGALWEDTKFAARHFNDIERIAIVGDKYWERGMAVFCQPFTTATIRYFDFSKMDEARQWILQSHNTEAELESKAL
ncbi:MAG TPA: STAS/SEC14 domain-containing protein [Acidobacteriota bacterium]